MKLYKVKVEFHAVVMAEDEHAAKRQEREIVRWDPSTVTVEPLADTPLPQGWDEDCIVYGSGLDMCVKQARKACEVGK